MAEVDQSHCPHKSREHIAPRQFMRRLPLGSLNGDPWRTTRRHSVAGKKVESSPDAMPKIFFEIGLDFSRLPGDRLNQMWINIARDQTEPFEGHGLKPWR